MQPVKDHKRKINIVTLGCSKNIVDSEYLLRQLQANSIDILHNDTSFEAKTVIINTCGFIQDAKQESINTILEFIRAKEEKKIHHLFVMGCLSQRYKKDLEHEIPDVDKYFGVNDLEDIINTIHLRYDPGLFTQRYLTTPQHYAYLKISEGCSRRCSFCAIPMIRGRHFSRPADDVVREATELSRKGVKELILIAQDLTSYGIDLDGRQSLPKLLERLSDLPGIQWIRLHYAYPAGFPKAVIKVMKERENICNYLDIPFQHVNDEVLSQMRRGHDSRMNYELIDYIRKEIPDITLRTTLMTGHPGEKEKAFNELMAFVEKVRFDRLGVFTYSEEEDTWGAENLKDKIPEKIKKARADALMQKQQEISNELNISKIDKSFKVLIDSREGEYYIGRTVADSPEVDNEVIIDPKNRLLETGNFYTILITGAEEFSLYGEPV